LAGTASNEVFFPRQNDYNDWKSGVSTYVKEKTEFQGKPIYHQQVTNKTMKARETTYNPITQCYAN
jgi:hypothetical protein